MSATEKPATEKPATEKPIVEFNHHSSDFHARRHEEWANLRRCPVAYNPAYGGFWAVSGYEEVARVSRDGDTFSSKYVPEPEDGIEYLGITGVPRIQGIPPAGIAEVEGPVHQALRRVLNPYLLPLAIEALEPFMQEVTTWFLDQKIESGAMDLVLDLANPVPAVLTMKLIGLECDTWEHYGDLFHATIAYRPGIPAYDRAIANVPEMITGLLAEAEDRRRSPREDLLTELVQLRVEDGRPLTGEELASVLWNLVGGGLDTTTSLTSLSLHHLDEHPDLRDELIRRPELVGTATEEFLRYYSVNESLTRTVTRDTELGGQQLHRGDYVLMSWLSANHDESVFDDPGRVMLDRTPNRHLAFGVGPHRCIGMHMARSMFRILLGEVLRRMPDYRIDREATQFYAGNPELTGVVKMPATFTPGPRVGPPERPF
jgi:cytochrome P450